MIFTLGNTAGMTFKEISRWALITKGTLTGVVDRLEREDLVKRVASSDDRRSTHVVLTPQGEKIFAEEFPRQVRYLQQRFGRLSRKPSGCSGVSRSCSKVFLAV